MAFIEILGLDDTSDRTGISERIIERYRYFSRLLDTAPTAHLRTIYEKKLIELTEIGGRYGVRLSAAPPGTSAEYQENGQGSFQGRGEARCASDPAAAPMLVLHTEGRRPDYFEIMTGKNLIGRRPVEGFRTIVIEDEYISRMHAVVECDTQRGIRLYDIGEVSGHKPSTNGVYLNGNEARLQGLVPLRSGDAFQVGYTKLVLAFSEAGKREVEMERVARTGFVPTVIFKTY